MYYLNFIRDYSMSKRIGNCANVVNWPEVIAQLEDKEPGHLLTERSVIDDCWFPGEEIESNQIYSRWADCNFNFGSTKWTVFRQGVHYSEDVSTKMCEFLGIDLTYSWINRVDPGCVVPEHYDADADPLHNADRKSRFICQISPPATGQVFLLEQEVFHNILFGEVYQWDHFLQWHSASNSGVVPVYYFVIQGLKIK